MSTLREILPVLIPALFGIMILAAAYRLWRYHHHPRRILSEALSGATLIGITGLVGLVGSPLWWAVWLMSLALLSGIAVATWRALTAGPPSDPSSRQATLLTKPGTVGLVGEIVFYVVILVLALVALLAG